MIDSTPILSPEEIPDLDGKDRREPSASKDEDRYDRINRDIPDGGLGKITAEMSVLSVKIAKLERKLDSIKLSSADIKAAKRFAKEIFNSGIKLWLEDVSAETDMTRDRAKQLEKRFDTAKADIDERIDENCDRIEKISALTYMILAVNGIQFCAAAVHIIGRIAHRIRAGKRK